MMASILVRIRVAQCCNTTTIPRHNVTSAVVGRCFATNNNASQNEVDKFSSFASNWWDARSNPLVGMNPIRIQFMTQVVNNFQPHNMPSNHAHNTPPSPHLPLHNKRILDIGCGGGLLTESLSRLGASLVVGVDASTKVVEVAKRHSFHENSMLSSSAADSVDNDQQGEEGEGIRYIGGVTVEELATNWLSKNKEEQQSSSTTPTNNNNNNDHELFDIITALEIIEHVPNPTSLLQSASSLLKPNGILFVSTINRTLKSYSIAIVGAEYISGKVPIGTHDWNTFWSPGEVEHMIVSGSGDEVGSNMKQIAVNGMVIEPPFVNMKWSLDETDTDVNWIGAYQKK